MTTEVLLLLWWSSLLLHCTSCDDVGGESINLIVRSRRYRTTNKCDILLFCPFFWIVAVAILTMCIRFPFHWAIKCFCQRMIEDGIKGIFLEPSASWRYRKGLVFTSWRIKGRIIHVQDQPDIHMLEDIPHDDVPRKLQITFLEEAESDEQHSAFGRSCNINKFYSVFQITFLHSNSITVLL